jgi:deoxyribose-phosphate aldolase
MSDPLPDAKRTLALIDLTDLTDDCREGAIDSLCRRSVTKFGAVAAVCIWPHFVGQAARLLAGTGVRIATVLNFPSGGEDIERAVADCRETLRDGADEIDLVMPYRAFLAGDARLAGEMIEAVAAEITGVQTLKVILETGVIADPQLIARASALAIERGAHFLKTSTGKTPVSATPQAAQIMLEAIKASGRPVGFKASGGIRTPEQAAVYLDLADRIMGRDWAKPRTFRFGASQLLDPLIGLLEGQVPQPRTH